MQVHTVWDNARSRWFMYNICYPSNSSNQKLCSQKNGVSLATTVILFNLHFHGNECDETHRKAKNTPPHVSYEINPLWAFSQIVAAADFPQPSCAPDLTRKWALML